MQNMTGNALHTQQESNRCIVRRTTILSAFPSVKHGPAQCTGDRTRYKLVGYHHNLSQL